VRVRVRVRVREFHVLLHHYKYNYATYKYVAGCRKILHIV